MKVKKLALFLLAGMVFLLQGVPAYAQVLPDKAKGVEDEVIVSPQWENINDITLDLYFEDGEAFCTGQIRALSGTTKISAVFKLERKATSGWVLEKAWAKSSSTNSLSFFETDAVSSGYTYRLSVTADVTRNGVTETAYTSVEAKY